jgi:hypothetical protein
MWARFKSLVDDGTFTNMEGEEDAYTNTVNKRIDKEKQALRAELLEQGDHDRAQDGRHVSMTFEGDGIVSVDVAAIVRCNASDLRNLAARANFMAWELEQQQREKEVGNG